MKLIVNYYGQKLKTVTPVLLDDTLSHAHLGALAENEARQFLEKNHLSFIANNFKVKGGEIDLIMRDGHTLVFVEVKLRSTQTHGDVLEMVSKTKQSRIIRAATYYLMRNKTYFTEQCRFDVVGIRVEKDDPTVQQMIWIKDAFRVQ